MARRIDAPLPPGSTIGILGGGQLGRMLAMAAARLGLKCHIYAPPGDNPAFQVADASTIAPYEHRAALDGFARTVDVVTYEFENVPVETAAHLAHQVPVAPSADVLAVTQDRIHEKTYVAGLGIPVPGFAAIDSAADLGPALDRLGRPAILKTRRFGYDGKGQARIEPHQAAADAWVAIGRQPAILEAFVPFEREISVIAARDWQGRFAAYDVPRNEHGRGILRRSTVPAGISTATEAQAQAMARRIMDELDYVGVMGLELFLVKHGGEEHLYVNEIAPRVHNTGHWTIDACLVSQFEQHVRAVAGWPLGRPERHSDATMENLIGHDADRWEALSADHGAALHLYGKAEVRDGRKMGHVNRLFPRTGRTGG
ncbi:MAG: 5-(carboxyamino)imidazole ribonucleotide synthase [Hyphomicrobiales bacterium]